MLGKHQDMKLPKALKSLIYKASETFTVLQTKVARAVCRIIEKRCRLDPLGQTPLS